MPKQLTDAQQRVVEAMRNGAKLYRVQGGGRIGPKTGWELKQADRKPERVTAQGDALLKKGWICPCEPETRIIGGWKQRWELVEG